MASTPETQYVLSGGNHIAYQVTDGFERDILYVPRTTTPIDLLWMIRSPPAVCGG